jgi:hypothetical protein
MSPERRDGQVEGRFFSFLCAAAGIALGAGAAGSVGLTLYAGQRLGAPWTLQGLFAMWVASPYLVLAAGYVASKRWPIHTRVTLCAVTPVVTLASLAIYGAVAFGAPRPKTAIFVMVAPASWMLIVFVVATAAFVTRQSFIRGKLRRAVN